MADEFRFSFQHTAEDFALYERLTPWPTRLWYRLWPAAAFAFCLLPSLAIFVVAAASPLPAIGVYVVAVGAVTLQTIFRTRPKRRQSIDADESTGPKTFIADERGIRIENAEGASEYAWPVLSDARLIEGRLAMRIFPVSPMLVPLRSLEAEDVERLKAIVDERLASSPRFEMIERPQRLLRPLAASEWPRVTYRNTGAEFANVRFNTASSRMAAIVTIAACAAAFLFAISPPHGQGVSEFVASTAAIFVGAIAFLGLSLARPVIWRKWFDRGQLLVQTVTISPEGVSACDAMSAGWLAWTGVGAAFENDRFLFFITRRGKLLHLIPKGAFESEADCRAFLATAKEHLVKHRDKRQPAAELANAPPDEGPQSDNPYRAPRAV